MEWDKERRLKHQASPAHETAAAITKAKYHQLLVNFRIRHAKKDWTILAVRHF